MKKGFLVLCALAACGTPDPTEFIGPPADIYTSVDSLEILVGDSVLVHVQTVDVSGTPSAELPSYLLTGTAFVSLALDEARSGERDLFLWLKAVGYGQTSLSLKAGPIEKRIPITTLPFAIELVGVPTQLTSLDTFQFNAAVVGTDGTAITNLPVRWSANSHNWGGTASIDSLTGVVIPGRAGLVRVTAGTVHDLEAFEIIPVVPTTDFPGTIAPLTVSPGTVVTLSVDQPLNAYYLDDVVFVVSPGYYLTLEIDRTVSQYSFLFPLMDTLGTVTTRVDYHGLPDFSATIELDVVSRTPADIWEPNDDPLTAPVLTGHTGVALYGPCVNGVATAPGADCDDFFTVRNDSDADLALEVVLLWDSRQDVNLLWTNEDFTATVGNYNGATTNPGWEVSSVTIPPQTTWRLWINLHNDHGVPVDVIGIAVHGLP